MSSSKSVGLIISDVTETRDYQSFQRLMSRVIRQTITCQSSNWCPIVAFSVSRLNGMLTETISCNVCQHREVPLLAIPVLKWITTLVCAQLTQVVINLSQSSCCCNGRNIVVIIRHKIQEVINSLAFCGWRCQLWRWYWRSRCGRFCFFQLKIPGCGTFIFFIAAPFQVKARIKCSGHDIHTAIFSCGKLLIQRFL